MVTKSTLKSLPWTRRLTPASPYSAERPDAGSHEDETTLVFSSDDGFEYDLDVLVFVEFEPGQNGGRTDPSWDPYFHSPSAFYFRPNHGWKEIDLDKSMQDQVISHFECQADNNCDGPDPDDYYDSRFDRYLDRW